MKIALCQMKNAGTLSEKKYRCYEESRRMWGRFDSLPGSVLAMADDTEQILYAEIDLTRSREIRKRRPYTGLRRTEWYK